MLMCLYICLYLVKFNLSVYIRMRVCVCVFVFGCVCVCLGVFLFVCLFVSICTKYGCVLNINKCLCVIYVCICLFVGLLVTCASEFV